MFKGLKILMFEPTKLWSSLFSVQYIQGWARKRTITNICSIVEIVSTKVVQMIKIQTNYKYILYNERCDWFKFYLKFFIRAPQRTKTQIESASFISFDWTNNNEHGPIQTSFQCTQHLHLQVWGFKYPRIICIYKSELANRWKLHYAAPPPYGWQVNRF